MAGKSVGEIALSDAVFGIAPNAVVMHMAVVNYLANRRQGTQSTLTRTEVSGGGKKPWRQKGTGHARQGSTRAPQWRHGGIFSESDAFFIYAKVATLHRNAKRARYMVVFLCYISHSCCFKTYIFIVEMRHVAF